MREIYKIKGLFIEIEMSTNKNRWSYLLQIGPIDKYTGEMTLSLIEGVGRGDIEVAKHAVNMNWPPCPCVMSEACNSINFELLKIFNTAWTGCPGSAIGLHCTDEILMKKDGEMLSFLIKNNMLSEKSIDMIGESLCRKWT